MSEEAGTKEFADVASDNSAQLAELTRQLATQTQTSKQLAEMLTAQVAAGEEKDQETKTESLPDPTEFVKRVYDGLDSANPDGQKIVERMGMIMEEMVNKRLSERDETQTKNRQEQDKRDYRKGLEQQATELKAELKTEGRDATNYANELWAVMQEHPTLSMKQAYTMVRDDVDQAKGIKVGVEKVEEPDKEVDIRKMFGSKPDYALPAHLQSESTFSLKDAANMGKMYDKVMSEKNKTS